MVNPTLQATRSDRRCVPYLPVRTGAAEGPTMLSGRQTAHVGSAVFIRIVVQSGSTLSVLIMAKFLGQEAVATYSVCLSAVWLSSIVFANGAPVMMRRHFVLHPETPPLSIYRRSQATVLRSPARYVLTTVLFLLLTSYIAATTGIKGVALVILMSPLFMVLILLTLKIEYHKVMGQTVRASLFEPGLLHLLISAVILTAVGVGVTDLVSIFSAGGAVFLCVALIAVQFVWRRTTEEEILENSSAQRKILATNLLQFVFLNGFPLFFAAFMIATDLGHFRVEERLFFSLLFFYALFETLGMKKNIAAFSSGNPTKMSQFYRQSLGKVFVMGLLAALAMFAALSNQTLAGFIGYGWYGDLMLVMALAVPFYFTTYFSNLVLNLTGNHSAVILSLLSGAVAFIAGAYILYPLLGLDGVRTAYLCGGLVSSLCSGTAVLLSQRQKNPGRA